MGTGISVPTSVHEALASGLTPDDIDAYLVAVSSKSGIPHATPAIKDRVPSASAVAKSVIQVETDPVLSLEREKASKSGAPNPAAEAEAAGSGLVSDLFGLFHFRASDA